MTEEIIKCPKCDWEYLPGEIFIPNRLVGQPKDVEKDINGKILDFDGWPQDLEETYICDHCGKPFKVYVHMDFTAEYDSKSDFSESYKSQIYKNPRITLEEE